MNTRHVDGCSQNIARNIQMCNLWIVSVKGSSQVV